MTQPENQSGSDLILYPELEEKREAIEAVIAGMDPEIGEGIVSLLNMLLEDNLDEECTRIIDEYILIEPGDAQFEKARKALGIAGLVVSESDDAFELMDERLIDVLVDASSLMMGLKAEDLTRYEYTDYHGYIRAVKEGMKEDWRFTEYDGINEDEGYNIDQVFNAYRELRKAVNQMIAETQRLLDVKVEVVEEKPELDLQHDDIDDWMERMDGPLY